MPKLILLRHGQSQWNLENRFTGWEDVDLSPLGEQEATSAGIKLRGVQIDSVYTSALKRAVRTATIALEHAGHKEMAMTMHEALNERHYGDLQGLNKAEMAEKYGPEQVHVWRRSFDVRPPGEKGESLAMTIQRVLPYFEEHIVNDLRAGKNVLIVAHGNSLRALLYHLDKHTQESIMEVNIPTGVPIVYEMEVRDGDLHVTTRTEMTDVPSTETIPQVK
ncbi:MAG TPA: 2,3-bisphosphoglycerate-dependent phosphoglycerate mutase [Candidatus Kapabacteria bacterium]|nr:2,3-bisphosphoglycerate-dependent phosphoglycerate mutase [Candidatus Kapabacteria bacterium]